MNRKKLSIAFFFLIVFSYSSIADVTITLINNSGFSFSYPSSVFIWGNKRFNIYDEEYCSIKTSLIVKFCLGEVTIPCYKTEQCQFYIGDVRYKSPHPSNHVDIIDGATYIISIVQTENGNEFFLQKQ